MSRTTLSSGRRGSAGRDAAARADRGVRIPADIDRPDRLLAGLTARQLAWLIAGATAAYLLLVVVRRWAPLPVAAALSAPPLLAAAVVAFAGRDGLSGDRLLAAGLAHWRRPSLLAPLPEAAPLAPPWARALLEADSPAPTAVGGWGLPVRAITDSTRQPTADPDDRPVADAGDDGTPAAVTPSGPNRELTSAAGQVGVLDLGTDGTAVIAAASCVNFTLRSPAEQDALTAAFGRFLNSSGGRLQILLRSHPLDLTDLIGRLQQAAGSLPHPALATAAFEHAAFLRQLSARPAVRHRQALLVLHDPRRPQVAGPLLTGRLSDAARGLARAGITVRPLGAGEAAVVLAQCADPRTTTTPAGAVGSVGLWADDEDWVRGGLAELGFAGINTHPALWRDPDTAREEGTA
jgi:hypothetical protein